MGIFARPFGYASAYDVGATPGMLSVGANVRTPRKKTPEEEKNPTSNPSEGKGTGGNSNSAGISENLTAGVGAGSSAGASNIAAVGSSARQHMMAEDNTPATSTNLSQSQFNTLIHPNPVSAPASPTKTTSSPSASPGFWSQVGHDISSIGHNSVVHDVMSFGDPFKSRDTGLAGAINPSYNSTVIQPSNVYSPSRNFPEVSSGSPKVIQGSVEGSNAVGSGARNAIGRSPVYEANNYGSSLGRQFMGNGSSAVDTSTPWYDSIPNDLSSLGEDIFAGL